MRSNESFKVFQSSRAHKHDGDTEHVLCTTAGHNEAIRSDFEEGSAGGNRHGVRVDGGGRELAFDIDKFGDLYRTIVPRDGNRDPWLQLEGDEAGTSSISAARERNYYNFFEGARRLRLVEGQRSLEVGDWVRESEGLESQRLEHWMRPSGYSFFEKRRNNRRLWNNGHPSRELR